jgi:hypothetical protein
LALWGAEDQLGGDAVMAFTDEELEAAMSEDET